MHAPRDVLGHRFDALVASHVPLRALTAVLALRGARAVVLGGWVRDLLVGEAQGRDIASRDIDLVVDGMDTEALWQLARAVVGPEAVRTTVFGGIALRPPGLLPIDLWPLAETHTFRVRQTLPSFEALLGTTSLAVDAVSFGPAALWGTPVLRDDGVRTALARNELAFGDGERPAPAIQAVRALQMALRLQIPLGTSVTQFVDATLKDPGMLSAARRWVHEHGVPAFRPALLADLSARSRAA